MSTKTLPKKQHAVQLVGPGKLAYNDSKDVPEPGPFQILAEVEACGLCFSDLKLLKQFDKHVRKSEVTKGLPADVLREIPSYVPGEKPTVPGHEVVCRIVAVGSKITRYKPGERYLIQPDFRYLRTAGSNSAFGYNFEGALQQYLLLDERVLVEPGGERLLLPAGDHLGASQIALTEPWACVEDSYVTVERQTIKAGGKLLVAVEAGHRIVGLEKSFAKEGRPASIALLGQPEAADLKTLESLGIPVQRLAALEEAPNEGFDDIVVFGVSKALIDALNDKLIAHGIINIVTGGRRIGALVSVGVGRMHYGPTRWVGTFSADASDGYTMIPPTGEVRDGDSILVVGAGGPMGQMHVIRNLCLGKKDLSLVATDFEDARLNALDRKARRMADAARIPMRMVNAGREKLAEKFSYIALMAPVPELVAASIRDSKRGAIVNVFAGIPAPVRHDLDVDTLIERRIFIFGTSGSTIEDIKIILRKVVEGSLNTNTSVDAISGLRGAIDGIAAVENRSIAGKIIVYPRLTDVGLIPLGDLGKQFPTVAAKLDDGQWCKAAEDELLRVAAKA